MKFLRSLIVLSAALAAGCSSSSPSTAPAADSTEEIDIDEGSFTVPPNGEVVYCVRVPMPAQYKDRNLALVGWESDIPAPAHHYFMFFDPTNTPGTDPVPCYGNDPLVQASSADLSLFSMGSLLLVAGTGHDTSTNDPAYGMVLQQNGTFVTNHHVINTSASPLTVNAHFKLKVVDATAVPHPTSALSCQTTDISLAPEAATDVTATCLAPYDLDVTTMSAHAHQDLVTFEQRFYDGTTTQPDVLYTSDQWDSPTVQPLAAPLHLKAGQGITFTCHYKNATQSTIGFGLTADAEMCAAMDQYAYPADHAQGVPSMLGATILQNSAPQTMSDPMGSIIPLF